MRPVQDLEGFSLRPAQKEVVDRILSAFETKDVVILQAPTGAGKSLIARTVTTAFSSSYVLTPTKALQDQYYEDFSSSTFKLFKGKTSYECALDFAEGSVADQECQKEKSQAQIKKCMSRELCPYYTARMEAMVSPCTLMNFLGFITWMRIGKEQIEPYFERRALHVIDEAHKIEDCVAEALCIKLSEKTLERLLGVSLFDSLPPIPPQGTPEEVSAYLSQVSVAADTRLERLAVQYEMTLEELRELAQDVVFLEKRVNPLLELKDKINQISKEGADNYALSFGILESTAYGKTYRGPAVFAKPLQVREFIRSTVVGEKTLIMSATLPMTETWANDLGLENYEIINMESTFPVKNRPIWFTPVGSMRSGGAERLVSQTAERILKILEKFADVKGIIHTPSYVYTRQLAEAVGENERFLWCFIGRDSEPQLNTHIESEQPTILVSPAMREGVDLKNELSRFQIIVKAPFDSLGDAAIKKKMERNRQWYNMRTLTNFMQMYGRSIRTPEDYARTYILDEDLKQFLYSNRQHVPKYVLDAINW